MKQEVRCTELADIRGKILKYLIIGELPHQVIINVGDKTFEAVKALETVVPLIPQEEQKTPEQQEIHNAVVDKKIADKKGLKPA